MPPFLLSFLLLLFCAFVPRETLAAPAATVTGYHMTLTGDKTTLRLFTSKMVDAKVYTLDDPARVVIDLPETNWKVPPAGKGRDAIGAVEKVRNGWPKPGLLRVVLDLKQPVKVEDHYTATPPRLNDPHALVVVLKPLNVKPGRTLPPVLGTNEPATKQAWKNPQAQAPRERALSEPPLSFEHVLNEIAGTPPAKPDAAKPGPGKIAHPTPPAAPEAPAAPQVAGAIEDIGFIPVPRPRPEIFTIVLDPGHGGVDPGAIGKSGIREKEVTLGYAQRLKEVLESSGRYRVVMTRDGDSYIPLKTRVQKAAAAKGHLFISLHADSHPEADMAGLSVYTLSEQASDKEAEALAKSESHSAALSGVNLKDDSREVAELLIDLARRDTKNTSARFAELVVNEIGTEAKLLRNTHRFAGFAVLKGIGVPSVLVELGYLSNPGEEEQLRTEAYRERLMNAIARAVDTYCDQYVLRPDEDKI